MHDIQINCESRYKINRKFLVSRLQKALADNGVKGKVSISVAICGRRKVRELSRRYLKAAEDHDVLSFPFTEAKKDFVDFGDTLCLGDIVICYPLAQETAIEDNKMMDAAVGELAEHGLLHLLGQHHE